jgi:hypothetical protein
VQQEKPTGIGKWVLGGLALVVAYQLGSTSHSTTPAPVPSSNVADALLDTPVTAADSSPGTAPYLPSESSNFAYLGDDEDDTPRQVADEDDDEDSSPPPEVAPSPSSASSDDSSSDDGSALASADDSTSGLDSGGSSSLGGSSPIGSTSPSTIPTYAPSGYPCAENGSCYGDISPATGLPKTVAVHGYFRRDGTYVRGYYRSHR